MKSAETGRDVAFGPPVSRDRSRSVSVGKLRWCQTSYAGGMSLAAPPPQRSHLFCTAARDGFPSVCY